MLQKTILIRKVCMKMSNYTSLQPKNNKKTSKMMRWWRIWCPTISSMYCTVPDWKKAFQLISNWEHLRDYFLFSRAPRNLRNIYSTIPIHPNQRFNPFRQNYDQRMSCWRFLVSIFRYHYQRSQNWDSIKPSQMGAVTYLFAFRLFRAKYAIVFVEIAINWTQIKIQTSLDKHFA